MKPPGLVNHSSGLVVRMIALDTIQLTVQITWKATVLGSSAPRFLIKTNAMTPATGIYMDDT